MTKRVFIAFASEDEYARDFLVGQAKNEKSPFDFTDMSVKEPYDSGWREKVLTKIRGCDAVITILSKNSLDASGQLYEIQCAIDEEIPMLGMYAQKTDKSTPDNMKGFVCIEWSWPELKKFIDSIQSKHMRRALIVGIDEYDNNPLSGCVADANAVDTVLSANGDGSPNFENIVLTNDVTRASLRESLRKLFEGECDVALFYFSGHGTVTSSGGVVVTKDAERGDEGITMDELMTLANNSPAKNKVIVLDCCNSGNAGSPAVTGSHLSQLNDGVTILTASRNWESAVEISGEGGVFTGLLVEALQGGASDVRGNITPGSLYSYVDEALGAWDQRPLFKTNVSSFAVIRRVQPKVDLAVLRKLVDYFPTPTTEHQLDPSYEPERSGKEPEGFPEPDPVNNVIFADLQEMVKASLILPVDAPHMWHAAINSKSCRLTAMGKQYWRLASENKLQVGLRYAIME